MRHVPSGDSTKKTHLCPPLSSLGYSIVTRSCQAALNILLKNYKRSRTQLQDSSSKLINVIMFHLSSELFTGYPPKHVSIISFQRGHSFFSDTAPVYLSDLLHVYSPSRQLRFSSDSRTKTYGHRSYSYAAPTVWNSLPREIRHVPSITSFKTALKTLVFKSYPC